MSLFDAALDVLKETPGADLRGVESYTVLKNCRVSLGDTLGEFKAGQIVSNPALIRHMLDAKAPMVATQTTLVTCPHCGGQFPNDHADNLQVKVQEYQAEIRRLRDRNSALEEMNDGLFRPNPETHRAGASLASGERHANAGGGQHNPPGQGAGNGGSKGSPRAAASFIKGGTGRPT